MCVRISVPIDTAADDRRIAHSPCALVRHATCRRRPRDAAARINSHSTYGVMLKAAITEDALVHTPAVHATTAEATDAANAAAADGARRCRYRSRSCWCCCCCCPRRGGGNQRGECGAVGSVSAGSHGSGVLGRRRHEGLQPRGRFAGRKPGAKGSARGCTRISGGRSRTLA
jgi:hypothetical protein